MTFLFAIALVSIVEFVFCLSRVLVPAHAEPGRSHGRDARGIHLAQLHAGPRVGRPLLRQVVQERRRVLQVPAQGQPRGTEVRLAGSLPGRE
ncbi:hypothetical protein CDAR_448951 [Caerostris darwini]|uniref:Secreted protein n=1 Tax=Caerostris darwini TaxID=1538125 RepID=A0AAV4WCY9_9ARAC|nr:hypothetical protein CDAR_448951 [Caerostris darwini]